VLSSTGRQEAAREAYLQAADESKVALARARLLRKIGKTHETRHDHETALRWYSEAEQALGSPQAPSECAPAEARGEAWWSEWIQVQINRVMVHYWLAREQEIEPLIEKLRSVAQTHGAGQARAQLFKSLAYMNMRRERFALSRQTVSYARGRLEASIEWGDEGEIVEARLMVALALLWHGDFSAAEQQFIDVIPIAESRGDATMLSRFIAYLLFAQRRRGDADAVASTAARCRAVALAAGMAEYMGIAEANLGWLAWRNGSFATARTHSDRALEIWSGLSLVYPFEWMARLVLLDIELREGSLAPAREHANKMLDQKQQLLPRPLELAICECTQGGDAPPKPAAFHALIDTAREHGFC
jgi:tetratricopeptide (TPR) repeat protein